MNQLAALSDTRLFDDTLPAAWQPLRELLGALDALIAPDASQEPGDAEARQARARDLRQRLLDAAHAVAAHEVASLPATESQHRDWFADAVLLWMWFGDAGGKILYDTLGSTTLPHFPIDFEPTGDDRAVLRRALARVTGYSAGELAEREQRLERLTSNLRVKVAINTAVAGVAARLAAAGESVPLALFQRMYGPVCLRPGDVELVCTSTVVFFCIPTLPDNPDQLDRPDVASRPEAEIAEIRAFLARVRKANMSVKNIRFPAFGLFDVEMVDTELVREITAAVTAQPALAQVSPEVIRQTLATMVVIIPAGEAEKYLIHDVWGHGWQESLCEFEWLFADFSRLGRPLEPHSGGPDGSVLKDAFVSEDGATRVDPAVLRQVIEADLRQRIKVGLNLGVAEFLADLMEHKFVRLCGDRHELPSSSLLPAASAKLDLSLIDLKRAVRLWRKPYRNLAAKPEERERLCRELAAAGVGHPGDTSLAQAVAQAAELIARELACALTTDVGRAHATAEQRAAGVVPTNVLERGMLGIVTLDHALSQILEQGQARYRDRCAAGQVPRWHCPVACIDLLALLLGWFYEQDHTLVWWHLDEYLRADLWPNLLALEQAIAAELG